MMSPLDPFTKLFWYLNWAIIGCLVVLMVGALIAMPPTRREPVFFTVTSLLMSGLLLCQFLPYEWTRYVGLTL